MSRSRIVRRRYAGRAGDGEFAVVTAVGGPKDRHCHRVKPCPSCPWRVDSPIGAFPAEAYRISASTAYDMATSTFACHEAGLDRPMTCAGFLLRGSLHSLIVRLALAFGRIDLSRVHDGGVELYPNYRAMAVANGVDPDDPILAPCRGNDYDL